MVIINGETFPTHKEYFEKYPQAVYKNKKINKKLVIEQYSRPCADCKLSWHPATMSLDHTERNPYKNSKSKRVHIPSMLIYPVEEFKAEIAKCEAVCMNCHKLREMIRDDHVSKRHWLPWLNIPRRGALLLKDFNFS